MTTITLNSMNLISSYFYYTIGAIKNSSIEFNDARDKYLFMGYNRIIGSTYSEYENTMCPDVK